MQCKICNRETPFNVCMQCLEVINNHPTMSETIREQSMATDIISPTDAVTALKELIEKGDEDPESTGSSAVAILRGVLLYYKQNDLVALFDQVESYN